MKTSSGGLVNIKTTSQFDVYIGRPSKWGNPFSHKKTSTLAKHSCSTRQESIQKYKEYLTIGEGRHLLADLHELDGKILGCFCKPKPCHGDVLLQLLQETKTNLF
jgi:hypothetical protein